MISSCTRSGLFNLRFRAPMPVQPTPQRRGWSRISNANARLWNDSSARSRWRRRLFWGVSGNMPDRFAGRGGTRYRRHSLALVGVVAIGTPPARLSRRGMRLDRPPRGSRRHRGWGSDHGPHFITNAWAAAHPALSGLIGGTCVPMNALLQPARRQPEGAGVRSRAEITSRKHPRLGAFTPADALCSGVPGDRNSACWSPARCG